MKCEHPMLVYRKLNNISGEYEYKILTHDSTEPYSAEKLDSFLYEHDGIIIPCGKCMACRVNNSKMWSNRCMMELPYHQESWFLTLTYDDKNLPLGKCINGEVSPTLRFDDLQDFLKRLRSHNAYYGLPKVRFFACGEYGERSARPHYHVIVFGLHVPDLEPFFMNRFKQQIYLSGTIQKIWDRGQISIGEVTPQSVDYVARYTTKKLNTQSKEYYAKLGIEKPGLRMSRRPGIGYQYLVDHPEIWDFKSYFVGELEMTAPRYFKKKLSEEDFSKFKEMQLNGIEFSNKDFCIRVAQKDTLVKDYLESLRVNQSGRLKSLSNRLDL